MEFTNFTTLVQREVEKRAGENYRVKLNDVMKNNGVVLRGITLMQDDSNISPTIYLNPYYDAYENGDIIGTKLPSDISETTYFDIYNKYGLKGDKKLIYRSELTIQYPYPIFEGEKYVSLAYKYAKLDSKYKLALMNEVVCNVEYMEDGSSLNMLKQYRRNPKGLAFIRIDNMKNPKASLKFKFKECIHYVSSSFISKNKNYLKESPCKILTVLAIPVGYVLYRYIIKSTTEV